MMKNVQLVLGLKQKQKKATTIQLVLASTICALMIFGPFKSIAGAQDYLTSTGTPSFAAPYPVEMGLVDAASGNLHLEIPLGSFPQRGRSKPLVPKLVYDSHLWTVPTDGTSFVWTLRTNLYPEDFGTWGFVEAGTTGLYYIDGSPSSNGCNIDYLLLDGAGTQHYFNIPGTWNGTQCTGGTAYAADGSGYRLQTPPFNSSGPSGTSSVYAPDGTLEAGGTTVDTADAAKDANGNRLSLRQTGLLPGMDDPVTDTLGRVVVSPINYNPQGVSTLGIPISQGVMSQYTINGTTIPVKTNFQQPGIAECSSNCTATVIKSIVLADGSRYSFLYDCDSTTGNSACNSPGGQSGYYGTLTSMTLPTGQTITYSYTMFEGISGVTSNGKFPIQWLTSKSSSQGTWVFTPQVTAAASSSNPCLPGHLAGCSQTTVARPDRSYEVTSFIVDSTGGAWPQTVQSYDIDGTLLSTVNNTWDFSNPCTLNLCLGLGFQDVHKLATTTTVTAPGGSMTKKTTFTYDSPQTGNVTATKEWKFQSGSSPTFSPTPDRATYISYATIGTNNNINHPLTRTVCNGIGSDSNCPGGGTTVARTVITYDGYGSNGTTGLVSVSGIANHDDANFGSSYTARGNPTQISHWVSGSTYLTTALSYDTTGQIVKVVDPAGNATTLSYSDRFYTDTGANPPSTYTPPSPTNAYATAITDPIGTISLGYFYNSGKTAFATDYNGVTTYSHYIDPFDRSTENDFPIGWSLNAYSSPTQFDSYSAIGDSLPSTSCASCTHMQAVIDQLGRISSQNLVNNPAGQVSVNNSYDSMNRIASGTHPHIGSGDPNNVSELTSYDGFGRPTAVTHPDGQAIRTAYGTHVSSFGALGTQQTSAAIYGYGYPIISVDETGKASQQWIDGFGRVIEVDEPDPSWQAQTSPATPATGSFTVGGNEQSATTGSPTPGTGSVIISGTEQSWQTQTAPATFSSGSVTISGSLQSKQVQTQAATSGGIVIGLAGGPDQTKQINPCQGHGTCLQTIPNSGTLSITVNGGTSTVSYGQNSTVATLAPAFTGSGPTLTITGSSGGGISITAKATGSSTNYSFTTSTTWMNSTCPDGNPCFGSSPFYFTPASGALSGGHDAVNTTVYDHGITTITINGQPISYSWSGSATTATSIAQALASAISINSSYASATSSGSTINLTSKTAGASVNYSLSSSSSYDSSNFSGPSFGTSNSGGAMIGGTDAQFTTNYDSGTTTVTVNGHATPYSWSGSSTTSSSIAAAMANAINQDSSASVNASASGATVHLTTRASGSSTNYSLSSSTSSSRSSFSSSASGGALTGGADAPLTYDTGTVSVSVGSFIANATYNSGSTNSSIATALANAFSGSGIGASVSGSTVTLTTAQTGASQNLSLSGSSSTAQPNTFGGASFNVSVSGGNLTGGRNAQYSSSATAGTGSISINFNSGEVSTTFDPCPPHGSCPTTAYNGGSVSVTVGGFTAVAGYGPPPPNGPFTTDNIAAALANALNAGSSPVSAVANGSTVTMTALVPGAATNFSYTTSSTYYMGGCPTNACFSGPSFSISPGGTFSGGAGGISAASLVTAYNYDVLGNLIGVTQGVQSRSYRYDGLGRLTQEITPEGGTTALSYFNAGAPCSGDPSNPCTKTDARGIVTTYSYDAANRLIGKVHNPNTTGSETYSYGTNAATFSIGRLAQMTDPSGSETYTYDRAGRVTNLTKVINGTAYNIGYTYNPGGQLTQITYPSGRVVQYSYDSVGHLCLVATSTSTCGSSTNPFITIPSGSYDAAGRPLSATYGNGVVASATYSPLRSQLASVSYALGTTTLFSLDYFYQGSTNCPTGNSGNNGQIQCITDLLQAGRSASYTYDALGRLSTANTAGSSAYPAWGVSEGYDRYGNRNSQTVIAGSGYNTSFGVNPANNQITGFTYDAGGHLLGGPSGSANFAYDGEDCNTSFTGNGNGATYICDGNNLRVEKVVTGNNAVTTVYVRSGGQVVDEYDNNAPVASPTREYIYGHNLLASISGSTSGSGGTITYFHRDHLSPRLFTNASGTIVGEQGHYPFGESWYQNSPTLNWVFTSYERDQESGFDYALARAYSGIQGRFLSPDPVLGDITNPQRLNRYAYALNDPINIADPSGKDFGDDGGGDDGGGDNGGDGGDGGFGGPGDFGGFPDFFFLDMDNPDSFGISSAELPDAPSSSACFAMSTCGGPVFEESLAFSPASNGTAATVSTPQGASSALAITQTVLSVAGFIPVIGDIANLANAGISLAQGHYGQAALFAFSAIPVVGELGEIGQAAEIAEDVEQGVSTFRYTTEGEEFFHYGYAEQSSNFEGGIQPGGYGTTVGDLTGAEAKSGLALPHAEPPNAVYKITPAPGTPIRVNPVSRPLFGQPGGLPEVQFPFGTGPGTVSEPTPI